MDEVSKLREELELILVWSMPEINIHDFINIPGVTHAVWLGSPYFGGHREFARRLVELPQNATWLDFWKALDKSYRKFRHMTGCAAFHIFIERVSTKLVSYGVLSADMGS
jgi:hypothetical protein